MPIGWASARHILIPLYCAGLWLAVNIAPGMAEVPGGEVELVGGGQADQDHVGARAAARRRRRRRPAPGELGRMSWPTTTVGAPVTCDERARRCARASALVDLVGDGAADVVRLEDRGEVRRVAGCRGHGAEPSRGRRVSRCVSTRRWPRRVVSRPASCERRRRPAAGTGRAASRTASASASRSSLGRSLRRPGPARAGAPPSRGAPRAARCGRRTGRRRAARRRSPAGRARPSGRRRRRSAW